MTLFRSSAMALAIALAGAPAIAPTAAQAQIAVGVSVGFAPPPLPVYAQPVWPGAGYVWTPGYWAWSAHYYDYFWTPGTWVLAPVGLYWTPPWWGWSNGAYLFHAGYWGHEVGYYGGIAYGFGYDGVGYLGGYWRGRQFQYNTVVNNLGGARVANSFARPVGAVRASAASFNGPGGASLRPTAQQLAAANGRHVQATAMQVRNLNAAAARPALRASFNHGAPQLAATSRPGRFSGAGVTAAARRRGAHERTAGPIEPAGAQ